MEDKKLLAFPVLSGIVTLLVLLTFAVPFIILPLIFSGQLTGLAETSPVTFYVLLFAFYVVSYFVVIFFNTALISCVNAKLNGKDMTVKEGLSAAAGHFWSILAWALVSATIGIILHMIEERAGFIGQIVAGIIGGAWALVTFFVVPVLVLEYKGVVDSVKESVTLIRKTWGESIVGAGSIMLIFVAIGIVAFLGVLGVVMFSGSLILTGIAIGLFVILFAILAWALVSATIGIILHMIEERAGFVGQIVAGIIGGAWALVTFFVVPVLVLEDKGVVDSVKESVTLIKKTWGESIVGAGSIMLIFVAIGIVAFLGVLGVIMFSGSLILTGIAIALFVIIVAILAVLASAMQGIFVTALYTFAKTGSVPTSFDKDLIQNAFAPKQVGPGNI